MSNERIEYSIRRSRRRSIGLTIDPAEGLRVTAPHRASAEEIAAVVHEKARWIARHLARLRTPQREESGYGRGDLLLWMGRELQVMFEGIPAEQLEFGFGVSQSVIAVQEQYLVLRGMEELPPARRRQLIERWAIAQATQVLPERVRHYAARLGHPVRDIRITAPVRQWGACTAAGRITMNWRLMLGHPEWADYVAAHEACHLVYRHHQPTFWKLVETLVPDYRTRRKELREAAPRMVLPPPAVL